MTTCPDFGRLRAWLDHEDEETSRHIAACGACSETAGALREDAERASARLLLLAPPENEPSFTAPDHAPVSVPSAETGARRRWVRLPSLSQVGAAAAALLLVVVVVGTPGGRSAAAAFLAQFRSERFEVVTFDPAELDKGFEGLAQLGRVSGDFEQEPVAVSSLAEARRLTGLDVSALPARLMPNSVSPKPIIQAVPARTLALEFDTARAPELPANFDGARLRVGVPAAVALMYPSTTGDGPGLVIGEAEAVSATVDGGPSLAQVRDVLLSLDGLPESLRAQLRAIDDWRSTLPLPLPTDAVVWQDVTVNGQPAVAFGDESGLGSAVLWQADGRIRGVGGQLPISEVRRVADRLAR